MNVSEIDSELTQWRDRQKLIDENLNSFIELPLFQRLTVVSTGNSPAYSGATQQRLAVALEIFHNLHAQRAALAATLDRANVLRAQLSRLIPDRHILDEIGQLLTGDSIELESSPTPPERRELLRDVEQSVRVSPAKCLAAMLDGFRLVRDTLVNLESAERQNAQQLETQRAEVDRVATVADSLNLHVPALIEAKQLVAQLNEQSSIDPLGTAERLPALAALLQNAASEIESANAQRAEVFDLLRDAKQLNDDCHQMHDRAKGAVAERSLKIDSPHDNTDRLPTKDTDLAAIARWLAKLETTIQKQQYGPALVGLKKWTDAASVLLANDRSAADAADAALGDRRALRGLFDALQAKAAGAGRNDPSLVKLSGEITQLFSRRPTPMAQVRQLVARYQACLV